MTAEDIVAIIAQDREPHVHVTRLTITLSAELVRQMKLSVGDRVLLLKNVRTGEVYLKKSDTGVMLTKASNAKSRLNMNSRQYSEIIRNGHEKCKFLCEKKSLEGEPIFIIFTRKNKLNGTGKP